MSSASGARRTRPGFFTPAPDLKDRVWYSRDVAGMAKALAIKPAAPVIVEADATPNARRMAQRRADGRFAAQRSSAICADLVPAGGGSGRSSISPIIGPGDGWVSSVRGGMHYLSTRGATEPHSFGNVLLGGLARDGGLFMPQFWPRIPTGEIAVLRERLLSGCGLSHSGTLCRCILRRRRSESRHRGGLCDVRRARCGAARRDRARPACARAVPWAHARLQRHRDAAAGPPLRPRAGEAGRPGDDPGGDVGRHRFGGDRGLRRLAEHRRLRAASAWPRERGAAPPDDDGGFRQCAQHRARRQLRRRAGDREERCSRIAPSPSVRI